MTNRKETNETGGRSRNPILITSHVELQTAQSVSHATGIRHDLTVFIRRDSRVGETARKAFRGYG